MEQWRGQCNVHHPAESGPPVLIFAALKPLGIQMITHFMTDLGLPGKNSFVKMKYMNKSGGKITSFIT